MKKPLIVIGGPTASGKTGLSIKLAKKINAEIISADSMQVYKYMDIGTAKVTKEEMEGIPHYLIDEFYPDEEFNVSIFKTRAKQCIDDIHSRGKIPVLVGGTGFYIQAVVNDNNFEETDNDTSYRESLYKLAQEKGNDFIYCMLKEADPLSAERIHKNNVKRVVRALEYYKQTGIPISVHNELEKQRKSPYDVKYFILTMDREFLYKRINLRVDKMLEQGLIEEVKKLLDMGYSKNLVSMQGVGYKEIIPYLEGEYSLETAIEDLKQATRHLAKRQLTWFNHQCQGEWFKVDELSEEEIINKFLISLEELLT